MEERRAKIKRLREHLYLIDDAGESTCYLVCGEKKAALIDTANGYENLKEIVKELTPLPVEVINTHGHGDHVCGNVYFDSAWIHPVDIPLAERFFGYAKEEMDKHGLQPCPFKAMEVGQVFDLGGRKLEVVDLSGHTEGSVGLLDRKDRVLYTGDGLNVHLWMQLDHSLSIAHLQKTLLALKENYGDAFDSILHGHAKDYRGKDVLDMVLTACDELLGGKREKDTVYKYFGGECMQHPLSDVPGECVVYNEGAL